MIIYPAKVALARLGHAAEALDMSVEELATRAVEEAALQWAKDNNFPGEQP